jgi:hypothetical protein
MTTRRDLTGGVVEDPEVFAERTNRSIIKLMKIMSITRTTETLMARMTLTTERKGPYEIEIDEPTVRAMVKVFDDFRAEHPDGKAPPPPPRFGEEPEEEA